MTLQGSRWVAMVDRVLAVVAEAVAEAYEHVFERLHAGNWTLGDIHPGNVVMQQCEDDSMHAWLIDFETVSHMGALGDALDPMVSCRILRRRMFQPLQWHNQGPKVPSDQTDMESVMYVIAWIIREAVPHDASVCEARGQQSHCGEDEDQSAVEGRHNSDGRNQESSGMSRAVIRSYVSVSVSFSLSVSCAGWLKMLPSLTHLEQILSQIR